jgi:hypothetical protein
MTLFWISLLFLATVADAANGPYLDLELGGGTRRIQEDCPQCQDQFGNPLYKVYANGDTTRLLARIGLTLERFDIYVTGGGAALTIDEFNGYDGKMAPAYGGGLKLTLYESPGYERFNLYVNPDILYFKTSDTIDWNGFIENHDISWTEYGVKIGGSARYDYYEPYGGVELSYVSGQETGPNFGTADFKERDNIGIFLGANYFFDVTRRAAIYGEIDLGDTNNLKVGIRSRF